MDQATKVSSTPVQFKLFLNTVANVGLRKLCDLFILIAFG